MGIHSNPSRNIGTSGAGVLPIDAEDAYSDAYAAHVHLETLPLWKLVLDKVMAIAALIALAPFIITVALMIRVFDGGPVFFAQDRIGHGGRRFRCYKFRTMFTDANDRLQRLLSEDEDARRQWASHRKLQPDPRISRIGAILRRTSLDEVPQFWNVLKGDMSIVGPRPIVEDERGYYGKHLAEYISVRPGLTGAWQVSGRSNKSYAERVALDVAYIRTRSFKGDMRIIWRTIYVVLVQDGAR